MSRSIKILILEDNQSDIELILHELRKARFEPNWRCVTSEADYLLQIDSSVDIILADYNLPQFNALAALQILRQRELDIPLIVVTGYLGDEAAAECIKEGAADYLLKDRLARLGKAVWMALEAKRIREEKRQADAALKKANRELSDKIHELEKLNQIMMTREDRILELKEEINMMRMEFQLRMKRVG